ncbi:hypothetical protein DACRYDRAFT_104190 [Dacryopinax primogenitus]|uniref:Uncharacterized protein n=1 Tax=Dacryopinax primogenitus (strain DJM 731) TaxID=1858805 RepID=M5GBF0_DACPD|nr:uncharacterized protein DACRYDRAFT_104190 [Dacryopinax primogenitus]EJU05705.1 hypothetical protein DACRYDRAFT_104190 [Dacryopinax primogenitus]
MPRCHQPVPESGFLPQAGLTECCKAFELDMLVMSPEQERVRVPAAIGQLVRDFMTPINPPNAVFRGLEERKLDYLPLTKDTVSRKTHIATVARFLAESKARNCRSNRSEFLRQTSVTALQSASGDDEMESTRNPPTGTASGSAARTAAKPIDRDIQMQYDIVKNAEGPLRRTTAKGKEKEEHPIGQGTGGRLVKNESETKKTTFSDRPGLEERFANLEEHLAVRYVPAAPEDLYYRVKALEDYVVKLEKGYPPWSALHFNQPQRAVMATGSTCYTDYYTCTLDRFGEGSIDSRYDKRVTATS